MTPTLYEGTKRVYLLPMNRGEYNDYRGWQVPADECPIDEGYLVEYVDGGKSNDARHAGYISWSPKDVAERAYKPVPGANLPPHQQRVLQEKAELDDRLDKLQRFIAGSSLFQTLPDEERDRLHRQSNAMFLYSKILGDRVTAFGV